MDEPEPPQLAHLVPAWVACVMTPSLCRVDYEGVFVGVAMTFAYLCCLLWYHDLDLRRLRVGEGED